MFYRNLNDNTLAFFNGVPDENWVLASESEIIAHELSQAKIKKIAEVKLARQTFQYANLTVGGYEFIATKSAKDSFFSKVNGSVSTDYPIDWRLADDISWVSLSKTESYALYEAMEAQQTSAYQQETVFYIAINGATSVEELAAININFV